MYPSDLSNFDQSCLDSLDTSWNSLDTSFDGLGSPMANKLWLETKIDGKDQGPWLGLVLSGIGLILCAWPMASRRGYIILWDKTQRKTG